MNKQNNFPTKLMRTVKPVHVVTSIKQSPVLNGDHFPLMSHKISY